MSATIATAVCGGVVNGNSWLEIFTFAIKINDDNNEPFTSLASYVYRFGSGRNVASPFLHARIYTHAHSG